MLCSFSDFCCLYAFYLILQTNENSKGYNLALTNNILAVSFDIICA